MKYPQEPTQRQIPADQKEKLELSIAEIMFGKGIKETSMDFIASSLKISKRTLYEIFGSKDNMISSSLTTVHRKMTEVNQKILETAPNALMALIEGFKMHRERIYAIKDDFFSQLIEIYPEAHKEGVKTREIYLRKFVDTLKKGVEEGFFRPDFNYDIAVRMLTLQMEALKRAPDLFPSGMNLIEIYDTITRMFILGICTPKGLEELTGIMDNNENTENTENIDNNIS